MGQGVEIRAKRQTSKTGKMPRRLPNAAYRTREYLTPDEVARIVKAARELGRHQHRDATLILIAYRHGLRVSELVALRWDQVDLSAGHLHVNRLKNGVSVHLFALSGLGTGFG